MEEIPRSYFCVNSSLVFDDAQWKSLVAINTMVFIVDRSCNG